jgi:hypothetical protein
MQETKYVVAVAAVPIFLLITTQPQSVYAWDGGYGGGGGYYGPQYNGGPGISGLFSSITSALGLNNIGQNGGGGPWWGGQGGGGGGSVGYEQYQQGYQPWIDNLSPYQSGWNHGVVDAVYDHTNSLPYNNDGQCCHSPVYWSGFHDGYRSQWNTYQNTQQTVNNYVNIYGNDNEVYLNDRQNSDQVGGGGP